MSEGLRFACEWILGDRIGGGGFGRVYAAKSTEGEEAAIKLVPKAPGAARELLFVDLGDARNVVPIIDTGETADSWALVMPRAEKSLRQHLNEIGAPLTPAEAAPILKDIVIALTDLDGKIVHRDLKPENILLLSGVWCLADFGISRYAEASTAPDTQKYAISAPYAAPERWRGERAEAATDIYSLGVIAFELLAHTRPFPGPDIHDFRDQHLHAEPPPLVTGTAGLRAMVAECLFKAVGARPRAANVLGRLERMEGANRSGGLAQLEKANLAEVARRADRERRMFAGQSAEDKRRQLLQAASASLKLIGDALFDAITEAAPAATSDRDGRGNRTLQLGKAQLELRTSEETDRSVWGARVPAFEVIAHSHIGIWLHDNAYYGGRSHSLWFCNARDPERYQWFEVAFMLSPLVTDRKPRQKPFNLNPGWGAAEALAPVLAETELAWPLEPVDIGDVDEFIDRWAAWFAQGAEGRLTEPSRMPERDIPSNWRKS
jgi:serine/threonine-protein kinase